MEVCSKMLFGHNFEITRRTAFGGIYSEKINNRKFAAQANGFPQGFYSIHTEGISGIGQSQEQLYFVSGIPYTIRIWAKCDADTEITWKIKSQYFVVHHQKSSQLRAASDFTLIEDVFTLYTTQSRCVFEVTYPAGASVAFMAFSIQEADNFHGMRKDVIDILKQLNPGVLRYPGGCFAENFHWKDGLLPVDFRPCVTNGGIDFLLPYTYGIDTHEVGIDEFIQLCRYVGAEPEITVRLNSNNPQDAADWVEYCNGSPTESVWGRIRAGRGHAEPYRVQYWCIGNEPAYFGENGLTNGKTAAAVMDAFIKAMKDVDPSIVAIPATGNADLWDTEYLSMNPHFDWLACHTYLYNRFVNVGSIADIQKAVTAPTEYLLPMLQARFELTQGAPISFDEWNYQWGGNGTAMTGLYAAGVLHVLIRNAERLNIRQACYFTPLNEGAIRIHPQGASIHTDGQVFALLSRHIGQVIIPFAQLHPDMDIVCTRSVEGAGTCISVINRNIHRSLPIDIGLQPDLVHVTVLSPANGEVTSDTFGLQEFDHIIERVPPMSVSMFEMSS